MKNRNGGYKKILLTPSELAPHYEYLGQAIDEVKGLNLSEADFTTIYLILFLRIKHKKNWLQQKSDEIFNHQFGVDILRALPDCFLLTDWEKEKLKNVSTYTLFSHFNLKGIPQSINRTMMNWYSGQWKLKALEYIPNSRELLRMQVENTRCLTLITEKTKLSSLVLESRDPLSFVLHDLMHADQFFNKPESLKGQLGFYNLVFMIYDQPELKLKLKADQQFKKEFEYVVSDMNAYVIHLIKCLKSAFDRLAIVQNGPSLFPSVLNWWSMNEEECSSAKKLNTPQFSLEDEIILKNFFEKNQRPEQ